MKNLGLALFAALVWSQDPTPGELERAEERTERAAAQTGKSVGRRQDLANLRRDLERIADELDRELLAPHATARDAALSLKSRISRLRALHLDARLDPVLDALERFYDTLERRPYVDYWTPDLLRAVTGELRRRSARAKNAASFAEELTRALDVPIDAESVLPENLTVAEFKKLGMIRVFLAKHRVRRPSVHVPTTPADLARGRRNVQIGVVVEGVVTAAHGVSIDRDVTFNLGDVHLEITPEWRHVLDRGIPSPQKGDRVRVRGWTYYDAFHESGEPQSARENVWEIHPVLDLEILPPAGKR